MTINSDALPTIAGRSSSSEGRLCLSYHHIEPGLIGVDCALIIGANIIGALLFSRIVEATAGDLPVSAGLGVITSIAYGHAAHCCGLYRLNGLLRGRRDAFWIALCCAWMAAVMAAVLFLMKQDANESPAAALSGTILASGALLVARAGIKRLVRSAMKHNVIKGRRVVLVGTDHELAHHASNELLMRYGMDEIARFALPGTDVVGDAMAQQTIIRTLERAHYENAAEIILALPLEQQDQLTWALDRLSVTGLPVRLLPDASAQSLLNRYERNDCTLPLINVALPSLSKARSASHEPALS
ncbi:MAG TPA: hypothetical protein VNR11_06030 [Xanthobacteraceae bacterium]|nr:hypothetical protein [Xanthobacteraceae bacterium]